MGTLNQHKKLEIKNLVKFFDKTMVLKDLTFDVKDGEFLSLLGPSGCGKTTILRILTGLLNFDSGEILKDGNDISKKSPSKRGMGVVFQNYALFPNMSVLKNVEYALSINKKYKANSREIALEMLEKVNMGAHIKKRPSELSGGQMQRVAIARTIALKPDIILFDEPMSALDAETRLQLRVELKKIQSELETTMIYITHDQEEAFAMSDRIMILKAGEIMQLDTPHQIAENPANEFVEDFVIKNLKIKVDSLVKYIR